MTQKTRYSVTVKLVAVGVLILLLLVPAGLIESLVGEREQRRNQAVGEIHASWSGRQAVAGPVLVLPVRVTENDEQGKPVARVFTAQFLPESLKVTGEVDTETRYRGIYKTAVYTATLRAEGRFARPDLDAVGLGAGEPLWSRAYLAVGLSDLRGVREEAAVEVEGRSLVLEPGTGDSPSLTAGLAAALPAELLQGRREPWRYSFSLRLRGSQGLSFLPAGKTTTVSIKSPWPSPSFRRPFLPDSREVGAGGFTADWKVLHLNRGLPGAWVGKTDLAPSQFGVELLVPVDHYVSTHRSVKYAVLFIFLTFLTCFFVEFFGDSRLHPIQYLMVGSAVVLFYLLLLSISEHASFPVAYGLAASAVVAVVGGYMQGVFGRARVTATVSGVLSGLYAYFFVLLQQEDYALLLGSLALWLMLAVVMYLTRRIDWYALERPAETPAAT